MTPTLFEPPIEPVQIVWAVILFAMGSAIGSFLNVIVYRWPAGLSIVRPASRCPKCGTPIRATDNVPILGWLWLRGRCRACREPISSRYPLVELTTALAFLSLGWVEPIRGGWNLPLLIVAPEGGPPLAPVAWTQTQLWSFFALHLSLVVWLLCESLWEYDAARSLKRLSLPLLAVGLGAPIFWPWLHPISAAAALPAGLIDSVPMMGLVDSVVGAVMGAVMGSLAAPATGISPRGERGRNSAIVALVAVGIVVGWQAVAVIAALVAIVFVITTLWGRVIAPLRHIPYTGCLWIVTWAWLLVWRPVVQRVPELGFQANYWTIGIAGGAVTVLSAVTWLARDRSTSARS